PVVADLLEFGRPDVAVQPWVVRLVPDRHLLGFGEAVDGLGAAPDDAVVALGVARARHRVRRREVVPAVVADGHVGVGATLDGVVGEAATLARDFAVSLW